jgi:hypothetical protein
LAHVLPIESSAYAAYIASGDEGILAGCECGRCKSADLQLTACWVERGFQVDGSYQRMAVVLARCKGCGGRERVLPCDVLPGKINSATNIFEAIAAVRDGRSQAEAGEAAGVSRQCVGCWLVGVAHRYLDLARYMRHRAMIAPTQGDDPATLVMFWAFIAQARTERRALCWPETSAPRAADGQEVAAGAFGMLEVLEQAGGVVVVAAVGAALFQQAVLLFRSGGVSSSSCAASEGDFGDGSRRSRSGHHGKAQAGSPAGCRLLAIRADPRGVSRWAHSRGAGQNHLPTQSHAGVVALGQEPAGAFGDRVSLDTQLPYRRARSPPAQAPLGPRHQPSEVATGGDCTGPRSADRGPDDVVYLLAGAFASALPRSADLQEHAR